MKPSHTASAPALLPAWVGRPVGASSAVTTSHGSAQSPQGLWAASRSNGSQPRLQTGFTWKFKKIPRSKNTESQVHPRILGHSVGIRTVKSFLALALCSWWRETLVPRAPSTGRCLPHPELPRMGSDAGLQLTPSASPPTCMCLHENTHVPPQEHTHVPTEEHTHVPAQERTHTHMLSWNKRARVGVTQNTNMRASLGASSASFGLPAPHFPSFPGVWWKGMCCGFRSLRFEAQCCPSPTG